MPFHIKSERIKLATLKERKGKRQSKQIELLLEFSL